MLIIRIDVSIRACDYAVLIFPHELAALREERRDDLALGVVAGCQHVVDLIRTGGLREECEVHQRNDKRDDEPRDGM